MFDCLPLQNIYLTNLKDLFPLLTMRYLISCHTFQGSNSAIFTFAAFLNIGQLEEFAPLFQVETISEEHHPESKQEVSKVLSH